MDQDQRRIHLIRALLDERDRQGIRPSSGSIKVPVSPEEQRSLLRALMNVRMPLPVPSEVLQIQDQYLAHRVRELGAVSPDELTVVERDHPVRSRMHLWRGDITLLATDAIMNAANSKMLGCFVPGHHCIDNAIHTFAGMQLRLACADLMSRQGRGEPSGRVKATPAFNLPSRYVLHTVGPVVQNHRPTQNDARDLRSCYSSCLTEATRLGCKSIALCCLATGIFGYPKRDAARIAIEETVAHLSSRDRAMHVVFDVFTDEDLRIYQNELNLHP